MDGKKRVWNKSGVYSVPNPPLCSSAVLGNREARFVVDRKRYFADPGVLEVKGLGPLICCNCGFESLGGHGCISLVSVQKCGLLAYYAASSGSKKLPLLVA